MIVNKRQFFLGVALLIAFFVVLGAMFSPIMAGQTLVAYADDLFNQLTKGSVYGIPDMLKKAAKQEGTTFTYAYTAKNKDDAANLAKVFTIAGAGVQVENNKVTISGDLGRTARAALTDADSAYKNDFKAIQERYGLNPKEVIYWYWTVFNGLQKQYVLENNAALADFCGNVNKKALEPAYNFWGIKSEKVQDKAGVTAFMLAFYVIYTVWYGFAIMYIFEGLGIVASAHGEKAET